MNAMPTADLVALRDRYDAAADLAQRMGLIEWALVCNQRAFSMTVMLHNREDEEGEA